MTHHPAAQTQTKPTFTLLVFTSNEIESLPVIMPRVDRNLFAQILVVDAHSTDGTPEWCRQQGYTVFTQTTNGLREAYQESLDLITTDYAIAFSPDGNSVPERLPDLVAKLKQGYDMVIVSRYLDEAHSEDDDFLTSFGNWLFTRIVNILHRGHYTDVLVMYRGYRTALVKQLKLDRPDYFMLTFPERLFFAKSGIEPLMSARASKAGFKVGEIPGDEPARIGGARKLKVFRCGALILFQFIVEAFIPSQRYRVGWDSRKLLPGNDTFC